MSSRVRFRVATLMLIAATASSACARKELPRKPSSAAAPSDTVTETLSYPPGRWRLAEAIELENTVLWASHILVAHEGSDLHVPGTVFDWRLDGPAPKRSRSDALTLARTIASKLARHEASFEDLARQHSDDTTSAALGGALGGTRASDFRFTPEVLDALAALRPGGTSRVVETRYGFQIFRLRPVPADAVLTGEHIVIGHDAVGWLKLVGVSHPKRTHTEALALARRLHDKLLRDPDSFAALVEQHSEHPDRRAGGDFGSWSVREPTPHPRAVQALSRLAVGAISEPYETHYGVEIVRRIPNRERPTYAAEMIKHSYDPASATSKREAYELARRSIEILKRTPERFNELEHTYCCSEPQRWVDGRDQLGLTPIAKTLEVGEFRGEPVEHMASWAVVKRMEPSRITQFQAPTPRFEVPAPERPSLSWALATLPPPLIAREIVALAKEHPGVATSERERELFQEIAQQTNADAAPARAEADPARLVLSVRELFQSENRAHYRALLEERLGDAMMRAQLDG